MGGGEWSEKSKAASDINWPQNGSGSGELEEDA